MKRSQKRHRSHYGHTIFACIVCWCVVLRLSGSCRAEGATEPQPTTTRSPSYVLNFGQDTRFGFYPSVNVYLPQSDTLDVSLYSLFWTIPSFKSGAKPDGTDLYTEFGGGVNLHLLDHRLTLNPTLGIGNGSALSGSTKGVVGDGIIPALWISYNDSLIEYSGWLLYSTTAI